ncbi:MAG: hypothetical protein K6T61_08985 [Bryobacteraceae bacterium]|nr:hypothetical protein [Bryobacteraceae bacterium]
MSARLMLMLGLALPAALPAADPTNMSVSPQTLSFRSSDPDSAPVTATASVTWSVWLGRGSWNLSVRAGSPTLANCPSVPVSAIRVRCASVSVGGFPAGSGACAQPFLLTTASQQVAAGTQGRIFANYNINIIYEFTDSWKYRGANAPPCSLTLTYTIYVQ